MSTRTGRTQTKKGSTSKKRTHVRLTNETLVNLIRERAYNIYCTRGGNPGDEVHDWLEAETQVKQELGLYQIDTKTPGTTRRPGL